MDKCISSLSLSLSSSLSDDGKVHSLNWQSLLEQISWSARLLASPPKFTIFRIDWVCTLQVANIDVKSSSRISHIIYKLTRDVCFIDSSILYLTIHKRPPISHTNQFQCTRKLMAVFFISIRLTENFRCRHIEVFKARRVRVLYEFKTNVDVLLQCDEVIFYWTSSLSCRDLHLYFVALPKQTIAYFVLTLAPRRNMQSVRMK